MVSGSELDSSSCSMSCSLSLKDSSVNSSMSWSRISMMFAKFWSVSSMTMSSSGEISSQKNVPPNFA